MDVFAMDVIRYGDFANAAYVRAKTRENYQRRFILPCWNEELPAARGVRTSPIYARSPRRELFSAWVRRRGSALVCTDGRARRTRPRRFIARHPSSRSPRSAARARARRAVGDLVLLQARGAGRGARSWLEASWPTTAARGRPHRAVPVLTPRGRILGDVTLVRLDADRLLMFGSPSAESLYLRWFANDCPPMRRSRCAARTRELCGLSITGPRARELLARVTTADVSAAACPSCAAAHDVGLANAFVLRLSFTGELGYEIYMAADEQRHVYETLLAAGAPLGLRHFGLRALNSLRLEKGYGTGDANTHPTTRPMRPGCRASCT